ncbi:MAG: hypothetical protein ACI3ZC_03835 [Candidatus Cryptobacteroides sp.]
MRTRWGYGPGRDNVMLWLILIATLYGIFTGRRLKLKKIEPDLKFFEVFMTKSRIRKRHGRIQDDKNDERYYETDKKGTRKREKEG